MRTNFDALTRVVVMANLFEIKDWADKLITFEVGGISRQYKLNKLFLSLGDIDTNEAISVEGYPVSLRLISEKILEKEYILI